MFLSTYYTLSTVVHLFFLDILIATPNRLVHLLKQDPPGINLSKYVVLNVFKINNMCRSLGQAVCN